MALLWFADAADRFWGTAALEREVGQGRQRWPDGPAQFRLGYGGPLYLL